MIISGYIKNLINWRARRKMIKAMIKQYKTQDIANRILEKWITERILSGQEGRREELIQKQKQIKETELFLEFLKKI